MNGWPPQPGCTVMTSTQVEPFEVRVQRLGGGLGVQRHPGALAGSLDRLDHDRRVVIGFDVEDDQVAARIGEATRRTRAGC